MTKKKKILITGAGGYVGATIAEALKDDYEIVGFGHGAEIEGDVVDAKALSRATKGAYAIIHTASPTKESWCKEHPYEALRAIVIGTRNVRRAAEEHKVSLVIHFSTQAVYSNFAKRPLPLREEMELQPDTFYGALKALAEKELADISRLQSTVYSLQTVTLRPANIYGIGAGPLRGNVIHAFAENARNVKPLILNGGGKQKVDFVHVRDIARLVALILKRPETRPNDLSRSVGRARDQRQGTRDKRQETRDQRQVIINVGSGKPTAIRDIARLVVAETKRLKKKPPEIISQPVSAGTIAADRWLSISKAKKYYEWKPEVSLWQGVKELLNSSNS